MVYYKKQGRLAEAEPMYQRAVTDYEKNLGPDHKPTIDAVYDLGLLYNLK